MNLAIRILEGEFRRHVFAAPRVGLPGIHGARKPVNLGSRERLRQRLLAKRNERSGTLRMQQQERGEYPKVVVPKHMAEIVTAEPARGCRPARTRCGVLEQIE